MREILKWLDGSKLMVAEVSGPSLGVGFEIAYALFAKNIPVLAVYHDQVTQLSSMITGCNNKRLFLEKYSTVRRSYKHDKEFY